MNTDRAGQTPAFHRGRFYQEDIDLDLRLCWRKGPIKWRGEGGKPREMWHRPLVAKSLLKEQEQASKLIVVSGL